VLQSIRLKHLPGRHPQKLHSGGGASGNNLTDPLLAKYERAKKSIAVERGKLTQRILEINNSYEYN